MKDYITITNEYFEILIPETLKTYGEEVLNFSSTKIKEYLEFFNEKSYGTKIKGAFLLNRDDFVMRIKEVSGDENAMPPEWATGCFYGGETQILLNENNLYEKFNTLAHESFHLLFQKFVYEKNNFDRVIWLDEALAGNFDGTVDKLMDNDKFKNIIIKLLNKDELPKMSELSFSKGNVITDKYNGYDLFKVVGRYLLETKSNDELLCYVNNWDSIMNDGENILEISLNYFKEKFNL